MEPQPRRVELYRQHSSFWGMPSSVHPWRVINRPPTPQDLLELSSRVYKNTHRLYNEADCQGMRVYHDELISDDVRLVLAVPNWFPKAHVSFDWQRLQGRAVSVVVVLRGTMQDLVGNTRANLQLLYNKLLDDQHLPDVAADATRVIQAWLQEIMMRHPELNPAEGGSSRRQQLHLDVHVTGHSLGGLLAGVATVESHGFAAAHGMTWRCTAFEDPGLPDYYHRAAVHAAPEEHWNNIMTSYLAAPNAINMLNLHLGRIIHVVVPWEQTWSHVAKCVGADVARVTAWAIVGGMVLSNTRQLAEYVRRQQQQEEPAALPSAGSGSGGSGSVAMQQCNALMPQLPRRARGGSSGPHQPVAYSVRESPAGGRAAATVPQLRRLASISLANAASPPAASAIPALSSAAGSVTDSVLSAAATAALNAGHGQSVTAVAAGAAAAAGEAAVSFGGGRVMHEVVRHSGLGVLVNAVVGFLFGRRGLIGVLECLAGVLGVEVEELVQQHGLGPMRQCFDPHTGQLKGRFRRDMASWPTLGTRGQVVLTAAQQVAKWTVPSFICQDNMGWANMMSRTAMVEARCARLQGYVVLEDSADSADVDAAWTPAEAAAGTSTGPGQVTLQQLTAVAEAEEEDLMVVDDGADVGITNGAYAMGEGLMQVDYVADSRVRHMQQPEVQQQQHSVMAPSLALGM